jgi:hypothetical protein
MRTQAQIEASRANGRRSQGPVTPEGKARSSQNAYRHGLLAHTMVLRTEDKEAFGQYLDQHLEHWKPFDDVELNLVEEMVGAAWRGRRAAGMQTMVYDAEIAAIEPSGCGGSDLVDAFNRLAASPALGLFHRYETHYHRIYHRCITTLTKLQKARLSAPAAPAEPAEVALPNEPKPEPPSPTFDMTYSRFQHAYRSAEVGLPNEPKPAEFPDPIGVPPTSRAADYPEPALPNEPKPAEFPDPIGVPPGSWAADYPEPALPNEPKPLTDPYERFNHLYRSYDGNPKAGI